MTQIEKNTKNKNSYCKKAERKKHKQKQDKPKAFLVQDKVKKNMYTFVNASRDDKKSSNSLNSSTGVHKMKKSKSSSIFRQFSTNCNTIKN